MYKYVEKNAKIPCLLPLFREGKRMHSRYYLYKSKEVARSQTRNFHIPVLQGKDALNDMHRKDLLPRFQRVVFAAESTRLYIALETCAGIRA